MRPERAKWLLNIHAEFNYFSWCTAVHICVSISDTKHLSSVHMVMKILPWSNVAIIFNWNKSKNAAMDYDYKINNIMFGTWNFCFDDRASVIDIICFRHDIKWFILIQTCEFKRLNEICSIKIEIKSSVVYCRNLPLIYLVFFVLTDM